MQAAEEDSSVVQKHGYTIEWLRRSPSIQSARVVGQGEQTKVEGAADSDFRFFPVVPDKIFGYILHPVDLATLSTF